MGWRKCTIPLNHACSDAGFEPFEQESEHARYAGCVVASSRLNYEVQEQQNRAHKEVMVIRTGTLDGHWIDLPLRR